METSNSLPPPGDDAVIRLEGVHKWFGNFHVLKNINLNVKEGERIVICGPSGSGKSTLIRCINRLEEHQRGRIVVNGTELTGKLKNIEQVRRETGMVFQQFNLFPHLTILENLTVGLIWARMTPQKEAEAIAMSHLERVDIADQVNKYPGQLSGGQQQRVAIARSLCMKTGMTMLCVTHEMGFAKTVADRVIFMDFGEIVEQNDPDSFFDNPRMDRTQLFLEQILSH
jgi:general L-amino acid transport system ATP-binding protein